MASEQLNNIPRAVDQNDLNELKNDSNGVNSGNIQSISNGDEIPISELPNTDTIEHEKLLHKRMQPILELVDSERSYVQSLKTVADKYIPLVQDPLTGLEVPEALSQKWRILWGNWLQLAEWHQSFLERLDNLVSQNDIERIPKLFIDSKTRLRSFYSKYCENHRKAALIAEQHRDFFEDVRVRLSDRQDVVSYLMKPVQRIMRYQLPMEAIVKCTERAKLPSASQWSTALDIMKEIPGDTQLILEAARIDGYPGTVTSLGKVRIREDLLVATLTPSEFANLHSQPNTNASLTTNLSSSSTNQQQQNQQNFLSDSNTNADLTTTTTTTAGSINSNNDCSGDSTDSLKFCERRLFLFDQSLLFTEEIKPKKLNSFAQSTFQFKSFLNVNKMRFEPFVKPMIKSNVDGNDQATNSQQNDDELKFLIHDISPGKECVYIINPCTQSSREAWIVQLRDILNMQHKLLLALQDPRRFNRDNPNEKDDFYGKIPLDRSASALVTTGENLHVRGKSDCGPTRPTKSASTSLGSKGKVSGQQDSRMHLPSFSRKKTKESTLHTDYNETEAIHTRKESCPESSTILEDTVQSAVIVAAGVALQGELDADIRSESALKPRSWSGFSFRLPRGKRDKSTANLPDGLFRHHEAPVGSHAAVAGDVNTMHSTTTTPSSSTSSSQGKKRSTNVFKMIFSKGGHKSKSTGATKD